MTKMFGGGGSGVREIAVRRRLAAMLLATTASAAPFQAAAQQDARSASPAEHLRLAQAAGAELRFDIAPQSLDAALAAFAAASGVQLLYDSGLTSGKSSPGAAGLFTAEEALGRLLAGSGLNARFTGLRAATIQRAQDGVSGAVALPTVRIEGQGRIEDPRGPVDGYVATRSASSFRSDAPLLDTPQSVTVIGADEIRDRGATVFSRPIEHVPGVIWTGGNNPIIRGFSAEMTRNGANLGNNNFRGSFYEDTVTVERIEILKGAAALAAGRTLPGGAVNYVTKKPLDEPLYEAGLSVGSWNFYKPYFDVSTPLDDTKTTAVRLVGSYENSESFRDFYEKEEVYFAPSLRTRLSEDMTLTAELLVQRLERSQDFGIFTISAGPNAGPVDVPRSRWFGEPDDLFINEQEVLTLTLESELSQGWSLRNAFTLANFKEEESGIQPIRLQPDGRTLLRRFRDVDFDHQVATLQNDVSGKFEALSLRHDLVVGLDAGYEELEERFRFGPTGNPLDIFNPVYDNNVNRTITGCGCDSRDYHSLGAFAVNQTHLADWLILSYGGRYDYVDAAYEEHGTGVSNEADDRAFSPRAGIVVKPTPQISLYASYAEGFQRNTPFSTQSAGQPFPNETSELYEVGAKYEAPGGRFGASAAVYELTRQNVATADPDNPGFQISVGEQRSRGFEAEARGRVAPGLELIVGYAYIDGEVTKDNAIAVGNRLARTPEHQASIWAKYSFSGALEGFALAAGALGMDEQPGNITNTFEYDGWVRFDAAAYYKFDRYDLALNLINLADREYVSPQTSDSGGNAPGAPRAIFVSARARF